MHAYGFTTLEHGGVGALSEAVGGVSAPCEKLSIHVSRFVGWARDTLFLVSLWLFCFVWVASVGVTGAGWGGT